MYFFCWTPVPSVYYLRAYRFSPAPLALLSLVRLRSVILSSLFPSLLSLIDFACLAFLWRGFIGLGIIIPPLPCSTLLCGSRTKLLLHFSSGHDAARCWPHYFLLFTLPHTLPSLLRMALCSVTFPRSLYSAPHHRTRLRLRALCSCCLQEAADAAGKISSSGVERRNWAADISLRRLMRGAYLLFSLCSAWHALSVFSLAACPLNAWLVSGSLPANARGGSSNGEGESRAIYRWRQQHRGAELRTCGCTHTRFLHIFPIHHARLLYGGAGVAGCDPGEAGRVNGTADGRRQRRICFLAAAATARMVCFCRCAWVWRGAGLVRVSHRLLLRAVSMVGENFAHFAVVRCAFRLSWDVFTRLYSRATRRYVLLSPALSRHHHYGRRSILCDTGWQREDFPASPLTRGGARAAWALRFGLSEIVRTLLSITYSGLSAHGGGCEQLSGDVRSALLAAQTAMNHRQTSRLADCVVCGVSLASPGGEGRAGGAFAAALFIHSPGTVLLRAGGSSACCCAHSS